MTSLGALSTRAMIVTTALMLRVAAHAARRGDSQPQPSLLDLCALLLELRHAQLALLRLPLRRDLSQPAFAPFCPTGHCACHTLNSTKQARNFALMADRNRGRHSSAARAATQPYSRQSGGGASERVAQRSRLSNGQPGQLQRTCALDSAQRRCRDEAEEDDDEGGEAWNVNDSGSVILETDPHRLAQRQKQIDMGKVRAHCTSNATCNVRVQACILAHSSLLATGAGCCR